MPKKRIRSFVRGDTSTYRREVLPPVLRPDDYEVNWLPYRKKPRIGAPLNGHDDQYGKNWY